MSATKRVPLHRPLPGNLTTAYNYTMALLLIIGPSGSGKSTMLRALATDRRIQIIPTWTTRPKRDDEADDIEHIYVSDETFDAQKFIAAVEPFGLSYRYGLPFFTVTDDKLTIVMVRAPQVAEFKHGFPEAHVYQIEAPYALTADRLGWREAAGETNGSRLEDYTKERTLGRTLADRVFVNNQTPEILLTNFTAALQTDFPTIF